MNKENAYKGVLSTVRWVARLLGLGFIVLFLIFFIGEGGPGELLFLSNADKLRLTFVPLVFAVGLFVAWKRELLGGAIMLLSVLGFNLVRVIFKDDLFGQVEFAFLLIPGILLVLLPFFSRRSHNR